MLRFQGQKICRSPLTSGQDDRKFLAEPPPVLLPGYASIAPLLNVCACIFNMLGNHVIATILKKELTVEEIVNKLVIRPINLFCMKRKSWVEKAKQMSAELK